PVEVDFSARTQPAVHVHLLPAASGDVRGHVDPDIAGAGIESQDLSVGAQVGEIADSADVVDGDALLYLRKAAGEKLVEERNDRRSLSIGGDVTVTEMRNDGHTGTLRDSRRIPEMQRRTLPVSRGKMRDCLTVTGNDLRLF